MANLLVPSCIILMFSGIVNGKSSMFRTKSFDDLSKLDQWSDINLFFLYHASYPAVVKESVFRMSPQEKFDGIANLIKSSASMAESLTNPPQMSSDERHHWESIINRMREESFKLIDLHLHQFEENSADQDKLRREVLKSFSPVLRAFMEYFTTPNESNKQKLDDAFKKQPPLKTAEYIENNAAAFLDSLKPSEFEDHTLCEALAFVRTYYIETYMVHVFHSRLMDSNHEKELKKTIEKFSTNSQKLEKALHEETTKFYKKVSKFVPKSVENVIDEHLLIPFNNTKHIAKKIFESLIRSIVMRQLVVFGYGDLKETAKPSIVLGSDNLIYEHEYSNYYVGIVMTSESFDEINEKFDSTAKSKVQRLFRDNFNSHNLKGTLNNVRSAVASKSAWIVHKIGKEFLPPVSLHDSNAYDGFIYREHGISPCDDFVDFVGRTAACENAKFIPGDVLVLIVH